jgi:hypothetical protein
MQRAVGNWRSAKQFQARTDRVVEPFDNKGMPVILATPAESGRGSGERPAERRPLGAAALLRLRCGL